MRKTHLVFTLPVMAKAGGHINVFHTFVFDDILCIPLKEETKQVELL